jgi:hypothetical protein
MGFKIKNMKKIILTALAFIVLAGCKESKKEYVYVSTPQGNTAQVEAYSNPLMALKPGNRFKTKYGSGIITFIVVDKFKGGISVTTSHWLPTSTVVIDYDDYDPNYFILIK